jgi:RsmE family RNA methyltransferase
VNLILLEPAEIDDGGCAALEGPRARHVCEVLKAGPGDRLRIGLLNGPLGQGELLEMAGGRVALRCTFDPAPPPRPAVDLLLAVPRPKVLKRLWAQLAALGVGRIALINAARVERCYFDTHVLDPAFFRSLLIEGLQQARDTWLPEVTVHRQFRPFVEDELDAHFGPGRRLLAHPGAAGTVADALAGGESARVLLAIGPEGGWVPFEMEQLQARGFVPVALGGRPLRTDTACVALLALVQAARA